MWRQVFLTALLLLGCGEALAAASGSSPAAAIVLPGATNEMNGVMAEDAYISQHYPGWQQGSQSTVMQNGKDYDQIQLSGPGGKTQTIYFDITAWFGKM